MDLEQRIAQLETKLEDLSETAEENNELLRSIRTTLRWSFWGRLLIWVIVLALPFIVLGPLLRAVVPGISGTESKSVFGLPSSQEVRALMDAYKSGGGTSSGASSQ